MAQDSQATRPKCFIEFRIHDPERFTLLERFFNPLRDYTREIEPQIANDDATAGRTPVVSAFAETQESFRITPQDDTQARRKFAKPEEWLLALRPKDLDALRMPAHREAVEAIRSWQGLTRRERRKAIKAQENSKQLRGLADFLDMLKYWQDVEYELISLEQPDPDKGRINYSAFDYPYKGKVALEELLMFFGFLSILKESC